MYVNHHLSSSRHPPSLPNINLFYAHHCCHSSGRNQFPATFFFPRDSPHYRLTQCKSLPTQNALLTLSAARHKEGEGRGRKGERKDASGSGSGKELHFSSGSEKVSGKKIWKSLWQQTYSLKYIKG